MLIYFETFVLNYFVYLTYVRSRSSSVCLFIPSLFVLDFHICLYVLLFRLRFMKWTMLLTFTSKKMASLIQVTVRDLVLTFSSSCSWWNSDQFSILNFQNPLNGSKVRGYVFLILSIVLCVTNTTIQPVWGDFLSRNEQICGLILFKLIKMLLMRKQVTDCDLVFAKIIEI